MWGRQGWVACAALWAIGSALGCAQTTWPEERRWAEDARWVPSRAQLWKALRHAALDPYVYVPAVGAAVLQIDEWDEDVGAWAADETPVFRSASNARKASDVMLFALGATTGVSALATPSGDGFSREWVANKAKGMGVEVMAIAAGGGLTLGLKKAVGRERPDGRGDESFPSGHSFSSFALMTLTNRNLDATPMPGALRTSFKVGGSALAMATAWSRVEARKHFPSDVLIGAALGRFVSVLVHDAWMLPEETFYLDLHAGKGAVGVGLSWRY